MAYVRFSGMDKPHPYESDIYVHADTRGGFTCCGCLCNGGVEFRFDHFGELSAHLELHNEAGHAIPIWMWWQAALPPDVRVWDDTTIVEMVEIASKEGGKVMTWDTDVPAHITITGKDLADMMRNLTSEQSPPTETEESSTSHPTET